MCWVNKREKNSMIKQAETRSDSFWKDGKAFREEVTFEEGSCQMVVEKVRKVENPLAAEAEPGQRHPGVKWCDEIREHRDQCGQKSNFQHGSSEARTQPKNLHWGWAVLIMLTVALEIIFYSGPIATERPVMLKSEYSWFCQTVLKQRMFSIHSILTSSPLNYLLSCSILMEHTLEHPDQTPGAQH